MNYVEDVAEKASSEALRDLTARILAGEIRSSGIVSRRALQAAGLMDQRAAQALWEVRPWIAIKPSWIWRIYSSFISKVESFFILMWSLVLFGFSIRSRG